MVADDFDGVFVCADRLSKRIGGPVKTSDVYSTTFKMIKQAIIKAAPKPTACLAHSLLLMPNLEAQIMLGILPGISIPPEIIKLISKNVSVRVLISGVTSIAAKVALSNTAESALIQ